MEHRRKQIKSMRDNLEGQLTTTEKKLTESSEDLDLREVVIDMISIVKEMHKSLYTEKCASVKTLPKIPIKEEDEHIKALKELLYESEFDAEKPYIFFPKTRIELHFLSLLRKKIADIEANVMAQTLESIRLVSITPTIVPAVSQLDCKSKKQKK